MIFSNLSARKKEVAYTIVSNLLLQVVTALCGFILPPLIIGTFGSSVNGMVSSISQFIAYLNIVEAGVGGASIAALYKPLALGDVAGRNGILSATAKFYNRSGVLFTVLVFVLAFVYPLIVGNEVDRLQSALMVLVLGITGAAEFFLIGKYRVLLTADKKMYVISLVQLIATIVNTMFAVILIKMNCAILVVKLTSSLVYLSRYVLLSIYVRKKYNDVDFHAVPDTKAISQSKNVLVHRLTGLVVSYSPIVLITIFLTLKDASIYAVYAMIFSAVGLMLSAFGNGISAFFGNSLVSESIATTKKVFEKYESIFLGLLSMVYSLSLVLIMPFMRLYTVNMVDANYMQPKLAFLFVVSGILTYFRDPPCQLIMASGQFKQTQWMTIVEMCVNLVASIIGVLIIGLAGILFGNIISNSIRIFTDVLYVSNKIIQRNPFRAFIKFGVYFLYSLLFVFIISNQNFSIDSYTSWFLYATLFCVIYIMPLSAFFFARRKFKYAK